ncbi:MAG: hypothetical protein M4579_001698 [Chaenotheca gracillima]|nr:MAG: hypothetical protein M4579_001698 [Chaenotheca gracillima]
MMNLSMNDPSLPGPGELQSTDPRAAATNRTGSPGSPYMPGTADPHHQRAPSLGELHQELEQEQEAQVQQEQLRQLQQQGAGQGAADPTSAAIDDSTPTSERSLSFATVNQTPASVTNPRPRSPAPQGRRGSYGLSRQSSSRSRTHSRGTPPPGSFGAAGDGSDVHWSNFASSRDESVFHQAEAQMLTRENQMLKQRIRELERHLNESTSPSLTAASPGGGPHMHASPLSQAEPTAATGDAPGEESKGPDVIGGGVVGLAIARRLAKREGTSTMLIERNAGVGWETSSRNSEVIHAGLYYPPTSLKTTLCLAGKEMLYTLLEAQAIPHARTGKWIVAQTPEERSSLEKLSAHAAALSIPTRFLSPEEAAEREPDVRATHGVLESTTTGIVDSHALMTYLQGDFEAAGGDVALNTSVTAIDPLPSASGSKNLPDGSGGYTITARDKQSGSSNSLTTSTLINAAGLAAIDISNLVLPPEKHLKPYFAKGTYYSYAPSRPKPHTLVYPAPAAGHAGLGTHLTLDLAGRIRFGPDVEWVDSPDDLTPRAGKKLDEAISEVKRYLPGVQEDELVPDYCGIRPKMGKKAAVGQGEGGGSGFEDFIIKREEGRVGFVNLLGIESPGLTSSLAIGEMVDRLLYGPNMST